MQVCRDVAMEGKEMKRRNARGRSEKGESEGRNNIRDDSEIWRNNGWREQAGEGPR